jgi:adenylate kinase family enzyme
MLDCLATLLIGPTGSGKTPLGEAMERCGIRGCRAIHFDFGAHLRAAVAHPEKYPLLAPGDVAILDNKLRTNALLEDNEFHIAEKILVFFITHNRLCRGEYLILNGLPRHAGQAEALGSLIKVKEVINLDCSAEVVRHRIANNECNDRALRKDDSADEIERKLKIFKNRTLPLLDYYRKQGVPILSIRIEKGMGIDAMLRCADTLRGF